MEYFVAYVRDGNGCYSSYQGMDQTTIERLLSDIGATQIRFISGDEFNLALSRR